MGNCCQYREFLRELDYIKNEMSVWGIDFCLMQRVWSLKNKVKEFFPINGVPQHIIDSLILLEERMQISTDQLALTCERIMLEVEEARKKQYPEEK